MTLMSEIPEPGDLRILRYVNIGEYTLMTWDACKPRGERLQIAFALWTPTNELVNHGEFCPGMTLLKEPNGNKVVKFLREMLAEQGESDLELDEIVDKEPHKDWHKEEQRYLHDSEENFIAVLLHHWHVGMDAVYGVGSYLCHTRDTKPGKPPRDQVVRAMALLEKCAMEREGRITLGEGDIDAHKRELHELEYLQTYLKNMLSTKGMTT